MLIARDLAKADESQLQRFAYRDGGDDLECVIGKRSPSGRAERLDRFYRWKQKRKACAATGLATPPCPRCDTARARQPMRLAPVDLPAPLRIWVPTDLAVSIGTQ